VRKRKLKLIEPEPLRLQPRCAKKRYETHQEATAGMHRIRSRNNLKKSQRGFLNVFYCSSCSGFHIGHDKPWEKRKRRAKKQ
jgi:predicted RNA-binding protein with PUA-like domain